VTQARSKVFISRSVHIETVVDEIILVYNSLTAAPFNPWDVREKKKKREALPEHQEGRLELNNYVTIY